MAYRPFSNSKNSTGAPFSNIMAVFTPFDGEQTSPINCFPSIAFFRSSTSKAIWGTF